MSRGDAAIYAAGGLLGMLAAAGAMVWIFLRSAEKYSERGFGESR